MGFSFFWRAFTPKIRDRSGHIVPGSVTSLEWINLGGLRFGKDKIYLLGYSYGSYLGMIIVQRFSRLFHAYVGVGQVACSEERNREIQRRWIRAQAKASGNQKVLKQLNKKRSLNLEKLLFQFGSVIHKERSWFAMLSIGLRAPEYNLIDVLRVRWGVEFTHKYMRYNAISEDLMDAVTEVEIPIYFFTGRFDYVSPFLPSSTSPPEGTSMV